MLFNLMKTESHVDAEMRTQAHDWIIKSTTDSLSALCLNKVQRGSVRSCWGSEKVFPLSQCHRWGPNSYGSWSDTPR